MLTVTLQITDDAALKLRLMAALELRRPHTPSLADPLAVSVLKGITSDSDEVNSLIQSFITKLSTPTPPPLPVIIPLPVTNLLSDLNPSPWLDGLLGAANPEFRQRLLALVQSAPTGVLTLVDLDQIPTRMRHAGFDVRETVCWHRLSRFFAGWPVSDDPNDPDSVFMAEHRDQVIAFWLGYLDSITVAMRAAPGWVAIIIINDGPDHCGHTLGNATLAALAGLNVVLGDVVPD